MSDNNSTPTTNAELKAQADAKYHARVAGRRVVDRRTVETLLAFVSDALHRDPELDVQIRCATHENGLADLLVRAKENKDIYDCISFTWSEAPRYTLGGKTLRVQWGSSSLNTKKNIPVAKNIVGQAARIAEAVRQNVLQSLAKQKQYEKVREARDSRQAALQGILGRLGAQPSEQAGAVKIVSDCSALRFTIGVSIDADRPEVFEALLGLIIGAARQIDARLAR